MMQIIDCQNFKHCLNFEHKDRNRNYAKIFQLFFENILQIKKSVLYLCIEKQTKTEMKKTNIVEKFVYENNVRYMDGVICGCMTDIFDTQDKGLFDFDVYLPSIKENLQRPQCWNVEMKKRFIFSVLLGKYVPPISLVYIETDEHEKVEVIDGKNRILSLLEFRNNDFPIEINGQAVWFMDYETTFTRRLKHLTSNRLMSYNYKPVSDLEKIKLYQLSSFEGVPQDKGRDLYLLQKYYESQK